MPIRGLVRRNPEHHLVEVCIIEAQDDGQQPFLTLARTKGELEAQMAALIVAFPEDVELLAVEAKKHILLEMLCQIVHMLLDELSALCKRRLVVKECSRRLFVDKGGRLSYLREEFIAREELVQSLHLLVMAETPRHEDNQALHAT